MLAVRACKRFSERRWLFSTGTLLCVHTFHEIQTLGVNKQHHALEINIAISLFARITLLNANNPADYPRASADRSFPCLAI